MKSARIFQNSWHKLCEMAGSCTFTPHQEQDIVCMMYHLCLEEVGSAKLIHASSTWNVDLILGDMKAEKRKDQKFTHCLVAEFKFILRRGRKSKRLKAARQDIDRLASVGGGDPTVRRFFAVFDNPKCVGELELDKLVRYGNRKNVKILYGCPSS
jgi:hypothetical protein